VWSLDDYAICNKNTASGRTQNPLLSQSGYSNYIKDHHKSLMLGGVSASAPFGTQDNINGNKGGKGFNKYGSKVSPFGTDDNEYNKNLPKNDHRQNGKSMNETSARQFKGSEKEVEGNKKTSNVIM